MAFLGQYQLGRKVLLSVRTSTSADVPTLPDDAPSATIYGSSGPILVQLVPIFDQDDITGLFQFDLHLDARFSEGNYGILYEYAIGGTRIVETDNFDILPGGHADGTGIGMYFFQHPARDWLLLQTDGGWVRRLRNPRVVP